jgi:TonB-dependent receptor
MSIGGHFADRPLSQLPENNQLNASAPPIGPCTHLKLEGSTVNKTFSRNELARAVGALCLAMATTAVAQEAAPAAASDGAATDLDQIVVRGYRQSLQYSTEAKREATGFIDAIFAEDIGKFPDTNIAESLTRIPGIQLNRDVNGEGMKVAIRGLGENFTKTTINGRTVATASIGLDQQNQNRETDLTLFPTEFFNRLNVYKSPRASLPEGGAAGVVDMANARPFDNPGTHLTYALEGSHNSVSGGVAPKGTLIGSWTNDAGTFGVLAGISSVRGKMGTRGWEDGISDHWTTPALSAAQGGGSGTGVSNRWGIWPVVPDNAAMRDAGLTPGETIDAAWLLARNPGLSLAQIDDALIPALGRELYMSGDRDRDAFLGSVEWRPSDSVHVWVDTLYTKAHRRIIREDINLLGRNFGSPTGMIPLDMEVDANNVVTSATFAGAQVFLQARPYDEDIDYWQVNPGATFWFGEDGGIKLDLNAGISRSWLRRVMPTIMVNSPYFTGAYANTDGFPLIQSSLDFGDPNLGWTWNDLRLQNEKRLTRTSSFSADLQFGDDANNVRVGVAVDQNYRRIQAFDNGTAFRTYAQAQVPSAALGQYLRRGPGGFIGVDYDAFFDASNFREFSNNAPETNAGNLAQSTGSFDETNGAAYLEFNIAHDVWGRQLRVNGGVRYVATDQTISGPVTLGGVRQWQDLESDYTEWLPSFSAAWDVADNVVLRASASKTMSRPNPGAMLPATTLSGSGVDTGNQGNPDLAPYIATNFDLGGEWYTGDEGFVGVTFFNKRVEGYTFRGVTQKTLGEMGIPYDSLSDAQRLQVGNNYDTLLVAVSQQVNADAALNVRGWETIWVQPLGFVVEGLGFMANYTRLNLDTVGRQAGELTGSLYGVSPKMWNATAYWENSRAMVRLSYNWAQGSIQSSPSTSSIRGAQEYGKDRGQLDLSASYTLANLPSKPQITLSATNLQDKPLVRYFGYDNVGYSRYESGRTITLGIRGTF